MSLPKNAFLSTLAESSFAALLPHLEPADLNLGRYLRREEEPIRWVYFPLTSLISLISISAAGESVETAIVGNEGAAGFVEACGTQIATMNLVVQVDGKALRAPSHLIRSLALSDAAFASQAWRLAELQFLEARQSTLCQAKHTIDHRLARWLLEGSDPSGGRNPLPITQDFLAAMLGVQRTTVSVVAGRLQARGSIKYARGKLQLIDRPDLEAQACLCRGIMAHHRRRLGLDMFSAPSAAASGFVAVG